MADPTHASSPESPTLHNSRSIIVEPTTTYTSHSPRSFHSDNSATASVNTRTKPYRSIIWQTPTVVVSDMPTKLSTVTTSSRSTQSSTHKLLPMTSGFQTSVATIESTTPATATATSARPPLLRHSQDILPDWPPILTIFLLSFLVMAWVVTIVLYLATFPEKVAWLDRLLQRRRRPNRECEGTHARLHRRSKSDFDCERTGSSAQPSVYSNAAKATPESDSMQGTATSVGVGLGISFDKSPHTPRLRRPRSFDPEALETPKHAHDRISSGTAPLPSSRSFIALSPAMSLRVDFKGRNYRHADSETDDHREPKTGEETQGAKDSGLVGVLESVNAVIGFVAGRLVRLTTDRVVGRPKDGLLLPVKDDERELPRGTMGNC